MRLRLIAVALAAVVVGGACDDASPSEGPEATATATTGPEASPSEPTPLLSPSPTGSPEIFSEDDDVLNVAVTDPSTLIEPALPTPSPMRTLPLST